MLMIWMSYSFLIKVKILFLNQQDPQLNNNVNC